MATYNFFGEASPPAFGGVAETSDPTSYTLGLALEPLVEGKAKAVRFYWPKVAGTTIAWPVEVGLWEMETASAGKLLGTGKSTQTVQPSASQWVEVALSSPVTLKPGKIYVVGYLHKRLTGNAGYWTKSGYFETATEVKGIMVAPKSSSVAGGNGRFIATSTLAMPSTQFGATNYGVDIVYEVAGGGSNLTLNLEDKVAPAESRRKKDAIKRADALASVVEARSKRPGLARHDSWSLADALRRSGRLGKKETVVLADVLKRAARHKNTDATVLAEHLARALGLHEKEALVVVEALRRGAGMARHDSLATSDASNGAFGKRVPDASAPTDSLRRDARQNRTDGLVVAELLAHAWLAKRSLADSIPLNDEFAFFLGKELEFDDGAAVKDALLRVWAAHSDLADTLAPTDGQSLAAALRRDDTAAVLEIISQEAGIREGDALSLSDARRLATEKGIPDHISLADAIHPAEGVGLGNLVELSDAVARAWAAHLTSADTFALADAARTAAGKALAATFVADDAHARSWAALRDAADVFAVVDAVESFTEKGSNPREHQHVADALERAWDAVFRRAEAVDVTDDAVVGLARLLADHVSLPEEHMHAAGKSLAAQIALADRVQRLLSVRQSEALDFSSTRRISLHKSFSAERVIPQDGRTNHYAKTFTQAAVLTDAWRSRVALRHGDQITPAEANMLGFGRPLHDGIGVGDGLHREHLIRLRDRVMPLDYRMRGLGVERRETMSLTDALDVLRVLGVIIHEALELADGLRKDSILALEELAELEDRCKPHSHAAHLALLALADFLQTQTSLEDAAALLGEFDDRAATTLQVEDASS